MSTNDNLMLCLGEKIRLARLEAGLTQEELAERIGISRTAVARYEAGDIEPKIRNLIAIANQLNVSIDELLGVGKTGKEYDLNLSDKALIILRNFIREIRRDQNPEK